MFRERSQTHAREFGHPGGRCLVQENIYQEAICAISIVFRFMSRRKLRSIGMISSHCGLCAMSRMCLHSGFSLSEYYTISCILVTTERRLIRFQDIGPQTDRVLRRA